MRLTVNEVAEILEQATVAVKEYIHVLELPNCRTCKKKECEYKPTGGEYMRINCPLWKGEPNGTDDEMH